MNQGKSDNMKTCNINECIEKSNQIIGNKKQDDFSNYQKITNLPTINHQELYAKMHGRWTSFLGVVGSFSPALNAICYGAQNIVQFDINPLNILNSFLQLAAMQSLCYEEYIHFFFCNNNGSVYSKYYFDKIKDSLPNDVKKYWEYLFQTYKDGYNFQNLFAYNVFNDKKFALLINLEVFPNNPYLQKEIYEKIKRKIVNVNLTFLLEQFGNIPRILKGQSFDKIYLSCLQNFIYDNVHGYNYFDRLKEYILLLNSKGVMEGAYIYYHDREFYEQYVDEFSKKLPMKKARIKTYSWTDKHYDLAYFYEKT